MNTIKISDFGTTSKGELIKKYTLVNQNGMTVEVINFGAIITSIKVADKDGKIEDVALAYQNPEVYFDRNPYYLGAVIGPYGNRIANAEFKIDDKIFSLESNNGYNNLHSGSNGFHTKIWEVEILENEENLSLKLTYVKMDGENGFPGTLTTNVIYTLTNDNALEILYQAISDNKTVVNLTQHSYFNLSGDFSKTILDHELQLDADYYLPVNNEMIPTGELRKVEQTPFDFRKSKSIGKDIVANDSQIKLASGYDHTLLINGNGFRKFATVYHENSGRQMDVFTDEPGFQLYTGNFIDGKEINQQGVFCKKNTGFCIETQHFPDSPNQLDFPSVLLKPEDLYSSKTVYQFSVKS